MRIALLFLSGIAILTAAPAAAQQDDAMAVQRCVWACLANSKGASDPAYHACVARNCGEEERSPTTEITDPKTVRDAQRRLNALGFNAGTPDGKYGRKTADAIRAFYASRNLPEYAVVSEQLLSELTKAEQ